MKRILLSAVWNFAVIDFTKTLMLKNTVSKQAIRLVFAITKKILSIVPTTFPTTIGRRW